MSTLSHRHEILFLYDASWVNPNGDPLDDNKPRYDEATGLNLVSDVRLKRTIRDELIRVGEREGKGDWVFVRAVREEDGRLETREKRLQGISTPEDILKTFIDVRLFGATIAIENNTHTFTGPVQFKIGYSLHPVEIKYMMGNTVLPSGEDRRQGTFRDEYVVRYSLIAFYGIANENSAAETFMSDEDLNYMLRAMWYGTKNLITRSKVGQMPRLLVDVEWKEPSWHLGELDKYLVVEASEVVSDLLDLKLDFSQLLKALSAHEGKLERVRYAIDPRFEKIQGNPFDGISYASRFDWS